MTKYSFNSTPKRSLSPAPSQPRPFDLDHQMRLFMVEKRSAGLHPQLSPLPTHSRTPSYNTQKQLPIPPSPPRKLLRLTSKPSKRYNTPTTATYFNSSGRAVSRTEIRPVPRSNGASSSAPSLVSPSEMQRFFDTHQKRPSSFIAPETPNDVFWTSLKTPETALPPRWHTPENSPLLPPPRGNLRTIPPPITIISPSPPKRRGGSSSGTTPQLRNKTSEIFESVLGISTTTTSTTSKKHIRGNELAPPQTVNGISPRRITIDSIERPPRTPPAPPTPAKSRAQRERARAPIPAGTPVGYVAELVGSEVEVPPVELMGDVAFPVIMAPAPKKRVKASKVKSKVKQRKPQTPEGREMYARLPLPDVPITTTTTTTTSVTPPGSPRRSCGSSPVLEVDLECFEDGLVEWFNNFNWSEAIQVSPTESVSTTPTTTLQTPTEFVHDTRASVVDPDGAVVTGEQKVPVAAATTSFLVSPSLTPQETALLSPVFPVSPRLASYYGARASFASSVGDAFRFDEEAGEGLSDVDERYEEEEEEELDVDEMYGFGREGEDGGEVEEVEEGEVGEEGDRTSLDSRLEFEIEMILNGSYGGGSPDDWRDGIYSAGEESPDLEDVVAGYWGEEGEGEIMVGLDIDGVWGEREEGRPKTRYIAGRNSAIEGDVVFCLRGVDSM